MIEMSSIFNDFFIFSNLNIIQYEDPSVNLKNHPSILTILQQQLGK